MSIRHSLLTILAQGPCYGYQLRSEFDRRTGSTWPINVGQIYNTLDRLVRDGFATKSAQSATEQSDASQHTYYSITDSGRLESDTWLNSTVERYSASRDELAIKLAIAVTLPGVDAHAVIEHQRVATRGAIDALALGVEQRADARDASDFAEQLVTDSMHAHAEAELRWLDHVETSLTTAQSHGRVHSFPLTTTKPKRGRPAQVAPRVATSHDKVETA
ncbi:PadR family transcriptional regulator [Rhodoglobus sp.]